jgi:hypothetical protein
VDSTNWGNELIDPRWIGAGIVKKTTGPANVMVEWFRNLPKTDKIAIVAPIGLTVIGGIIE